MSTMELPLRLCINEELIQIRNPESNPIDISLKIRLESCFRLDQSCVGLKLGFSQI